MNEGEIAENEGGSVEEKATQLAKKIEIAQEAGDTQALTAIAKEVQSDPQIMAALEKRRSDDAKNQENEQDIGKIQQAITELGTKLTRIIQLSTQAMEEGAVTESLFRNEEEKNLVVNKTKALVEAVRNATTTQQATEAVNIFSEWYQKSQPVLADRTRAKIGYFGGSLPDGLLTQAHMFDSLQSDIDDAKHYLESTKE